MKKIRRIKRMDIKVLWNARGMRNKKEELMKRIQDYDVCIITELKNNIKQDFLKILGFVVINKSSHRTGRIAAGGIAIIVRNNIRVKEITKINSSNVNIEVLGIQILGLTKELTIIAVYKTRGDSRERELAENIRQNRTN